MNGNAYDTHIFTIILLPSDRSAVVRLISYDLKKINHSSNCWNMNLYPTKYKIMVLSISTSQKPIHPSMQVNGVFVKEECILNVLGVTLDTKLTYGRHRNNTASRTRPNGILLKAAAIYFSYLVYRG